MAESVDADLNLSTSDAQASVAALGSDLEEALASAAASFADAFDSVVSGLPTVELEADASAFAPAIDDAIAGADSAVPLEAEGAEQLSLAIDDAIASADTAVPLEAEGADAIAGEISAAIDSADTGVPLEATGAESITGEIDQAIAAADTTVEVDADVTAAAESITELGSEAGGASGEVDALGGSVSGLQAVSGLATGSTAGLGSAVGDMGAGAGAAVGGVAAVGGAVAYMFAQAVDAQGATFRLDQTMGGLASRVNTIQVGSLNTDLSALAITLGSDDDNMRNTAASAYNMATAFGKGKGESADFAGQLLAIAARSVAVNPALGDTGDAANQLLRALQSGREKALIPFQLGLSGAEINARALQIAMDDGRDTANASDKAFAGVELSVRKFGGTLDETITRGAENPTIKLRSLKQQVIENIEALGMPLVAPLFDIMDKGVPVAEKAGRVIAELASAGLPLLSAALEVAEPFLGALADGLDVIGSDGIRAALIIAGVTYALVQLPVALAAISVAMSSNPLGLIAVGATLAVAALGLFSGGEDEAAASTDDFTKALIDNNGALDQNAAKALRAALETRHQLDDLNRAGVSFQQYTTAIASSGDATDKQVAKLHQYAQGVLLGTTTNADFIAALRGISPELGTMASQLDRAGELNGGLVRSILEQIGAQRTATQTTKERTEAGATDAQVSDAQAQAATREAQARDAAKQSVTDYKNALDGLISPQLGLTSAQTDQESSLIRLREAFAQQVDASHSAESVELSRTQALIAATSSAQSLAGATYNVAVGLYGQQAAAGAANGVMQSFAATMRDQLITGFGMSAEAADAMLGKLGLLQFVAPPAGAAVAGVGTAATGAAAETGTAAGAYEFAVQQIALATGVSMEQARAAVAGSGIPEAVGQVGAAHTAAAGETTAAGVTYDAAVRDIALATGVSMAEAKAYIDGSGIPGAAGAQGTGAVDQFGNPIASGMPAAVQSAQDAAGAVFNRNELRDTAGGTGRAVGKSFGDGVVQGIGSRVDDIAQAAAQAVRAAEAAARSEAQSHSPSRLFAELGADLGSGIAVGLDQSQLSVMRAAENIIDRAASVSSAPQAQSAGASIDMRIHVHGVTDPALARTVGGEFGRGAVDALARRGVVIAARVGG